MDYEKFDSIVLETVKSIYYVCDKDTHEMLHLSKQAMELCGIKSSEEYKGVKCYELLQGLGSPCSFCTNDKLRENELYKWEHYNEKLKRWFELTDTLVNIDGRLCRVEIARDITGRKTIIDRLEEELSYEELLQSCAHILAVEKDFNSAVNIFLGIIGRYYSANRAYIIEFDLKNSTTFNTFEWCADGVTPEIDNLQDIPLAYVDDWVKKFERDGRFFISSREDEVSHNSPEYQILKNQGIESLMAVPFKSGDTVVGFIGVDDPHTEAGNFKLVQAASEFIMAELEKRRLMEELEYISYRDVLTGAKNRNEYVRTLRNFDWRSLSSLGVVFADINGLKEINDTRGHRFGDHVLKRVVGLLRDNVSDEVYRVDGDEFIVICKNMSKEEFQERVTRLREASISDKDADVAIGCVWSDDRRDIEKQVLQADEQMYAEKQEYYRLAFASGRAVRKGFAGEVLADIEKGRFFLVFQPQVDLKTGRIVGAEALVRKRSDDGGIVPPDKFISFYEAEGVIRHLDLYVLEQACKTLKGWIDLGFDLNISINFSRVTLLETDIVNTISAVCDSLGVPPRYITIEVTETMNKVEQEVLKKLAEELCKKGFSVSLDDFGSKYSNLAILSAMDFDEIKLDKALIDDIEANVKSRTVIYHSVRMCKELGGTMVVAEGIEKREQMELLIECECDIGQGYYFSKPVIAPEFDELIKRGEPIV